jgi:hypothetical protein
MNLAELLALLVNIESMTDAELGDYLADLQSAASSEEDVDLVVQAADAADAVRAEQTVRTERAEAETARREEALARLAGDPEVDESDPDPEAEPETDEESTEEEDPEHTEDVEAEQVEAEEVAEPIAASAPSKVSKVAARRPASTQPRRTGGLPATFEDWGLVASANAPGVSMGSKIRRPEQLCELLENAWQATRGFSGPGMQMKLARRGWDSPAAMYGEERTLSDNAKSNERKIRQVVNARSQSFQSLQSTGGICSPINVSYDLPTLGDDGRPFRDKALTRFGAERGGVATIPPPTLTDLDGAISVWTEANDRTPADPTTKPCLTITCPEEDEDLVDAIVRCLKTGNFRARFFPEQLEAWMRLAAVQWAREAEIKHITRVGTDSTQVSAGQILGTSRDILTTLDRILAARRSYHRDYSIGWTYAAPYWLLDMIRTDIARQMPVGTLDETLALADAAISRWFAVRGLTPVWLYDGEVADGQIFGPQGDGPALGWPDHVVQYLYPTGSWLFLDGGTLDLGIVRDSTLNSTNDFQLFAESFEGTHFHGDPDTTMRIESDVCPDGSASALVDISPCVVGS